MKIQNINSNNNNSQISFNAKSDFSSIKKMLSPEVFDEFTALANSIKPEDSLIKASIQTVKRTFTEPRRYISSTTYSKDGRLRVGSTKCGIKTPEEAISEIRESLLELKKYYS